MADAKTRKRRISNSRAGTADTTTSTSSSPVKQNTLLAIPIAMLNLMLLLSHFSSQQIFQPENDVALFESQQQQTTSPLNSVVPPMTTATLSTLTTSSNLAPDEATATTSRISPDPTLPIPTSDSSLPKTSSSKGVILTSYLTYKQDPRKFGKVPHRKHATFDDIYHFYTTVIFYKLRAVILHDRAFTSDFIEKYAKPPFITFVQVEPPTYNVTEDTMVVNDYRYIVTNEYFQQHSQTTFQDIEWYLVADLDVFFNRDPFETLIEYHKKDKQTLFGSWDGGSWQDEQTRLQRSQFRKCYGHRFLRNLTEDQWNTRNGNCGLWAGTTPKVQCMLQCMSDQFTKGAPKGRDGTNCCDMAVHDWCVMFGGCVEPEELRWGEDTLGNVEHGLIFGPPYARKHHTCLREYAVTHNRCDTPWYPPICFREVTDAEGETKLEKYHQVGHQGKKCKLDPTTDLPLPNNETEVWNKQR